MGGGHHHHSPGAMPKDEQDLELLKREQVPVPYRDKCAHLLVPLNRCRQETFSNPHRCTQQRHIYEECQFILYTRRCEAKTAMKAAQASAAAEAAAQEAASM